MRCGWCGLDYDVKPEKQLEFYYIYEADWHGYIEISSCPNKKCHKANIILHEYGWEMDDGPEGPSQFKIGETWKNIWPGEKNCPSEVPEYIAKDYLDACKIQSVPNASVVMSRRCLQALLKDVVGTKSSNLNRQINEALKKGGIPTYLVDAFHIIREIGNLGAHSSEDKTTGEILNTEAEEAEWNLKALRMLFDFYYVLPSEVQKEMEKINAILKKSGKPTLK